MNLLEILDAPPGGSSGRGLSYFKTLMKCGRKAALEAEHPSRGGAGMREGTHLHTLMELYHGRELSPKYSEGMLSHESLAMAYGHTSDPDLEEAFRVYRGYIAKVRPDTWGKYISVERQVPDNDTERANIADIFGTDLTARMDGVVEVDEIDCQRILRNFNMMLLPGRYLLDYKFLAKRMQVWLQDYEHGLQFALYPLLWNIAKPDERVNGTIVVRVYKTKEIVVEPVCVPLPNAAQIRMVYEWLALAQHREQTEWNVPNVTSCFADMSPCAYFTNNLCSRLNQTKESTPNGSSEQFPNEAA